MSAFPKELGKLGYVFNFITYGGHQVDGLASEEFATALKEDGMLALARLQRKLRLINSPYKTPQSYVGGPRLDGALMASSGRTSTTKAMGTMNATMSRAAFAPRSLIMMKKLATHGTKRVIVTMDTTSCTGVRRPSRARS